MTLGLDLIVTFTQMLSEAMNTKSFGNTVGTTEKKVKRSNN